MTGILTIALNPAIDISSEAENVQPTRKIRTFDERQYPGGGGINVARVLVTFGGSPDLLYMAGGPTGILLEDFLGQTPIRSHRIGIADATRIAFAVHERQTGFEYRFVPEGPEITADELQPVFAFLEEDTSEYIVASGSLPRGAPPDTYARMADMAGRRNARFVLDTSGDSLAAALSRSSVFLVKPSLGELERLAGRSLDEQGIQQTALDLVRRGSAQYVAVTLGTQGAMLASADGVLRVPAKHVTVRSAVGAGDSFVGALVHWLAEGHSIDEAFRFGVAAGAAAVMTPGTQLCRREDVMTLYRDDTGVT